LDTFRAPFGLSATIHFRYDSPGRLTLPAALRYNKGMVQPLCSALLEKIREEIERSTHLLELLPPVPLEWTPPIPDARPVGWLIGHMLECLAGFCAVLYAVRREELARFERLKSLPVNHLCGTEEAHRRIAEYEAHIEQGMALLHDTDLACRVPTVFVPEGELLLTLLLGNLEHLINHKYQFLIYLKLAGGVAGTRDLYKFRGR
jgi:hypothetical protein